jgi:uncharacterized protein
MDFSRLIDLIGLAGAVLTTLWWLPQVMKAVRDKETRALSIGYRWVYRRGRALADLRAGDQRLAADRLQRGDAGADGPLTGGVRLWIAIAARRFSQPREIPMPVLSPYLLPVALLVGSNVFMTTAWYWHLRFKEVALWQVILISWGLAFFEYCLAVPANRYGSAVYSAAQLKTLQEVVTLSVFAVFSIVYLKQGITLNHVVGFALIASGAFFVFRGPL